MQTFGKLVSAYTFGRIKLIQHLLYFNTSMIYKQDNHWIYYDQHFVVCDDCIIRDEVIEYRIAQNFDGY